MKEDEVLTPNELIQLFKISPRSLENLLQDPTFPARNISGQWRFLRSAVLNWLGCMMLQPAASPAQVKSVTDTNIAAGTSPAANEATQSTEPAIEQMLDYTPGQAFAGANRVVNRKGSKETNPKLKDPGVFKELPASEKGDLLAGLND